MNHRSASIRSSYAMAALLLVAIMIILGGCTTVVQPIEHYTTDDGNLSVTFPASWDVVDDMVADGRTMLYVASNNGRIDEPSEIESGLIIVLLPDFIVGVEGKLVPVSATTLADMAYYDLMADVNNELGPIETFEFENGTTANRFSVTDKTSSGMFYTFALEDSILVTAVAVTRLDTEIGPVVEQILETVTFSGDAESYVDNVKTLWGVE